MSTTLTAGDIAIIGYNADGATKPFSFVFLRDVDAATEIKFTDNGWLLSGGFRPNEGTVTYTTSGPVTAGTVVTLNITGNFNPAGAGDQILAYQGESSNPTFIYAIDFADGNTAFAGDATSSNTSALPPGLTLGQTAVGVGPDNARYTGSTSGTREQLLTSISTSANWTGSDTENVTVPAIPFDVSRTGAAPTLISLTLEDASQSEGETYAFTVNLSGPAQGDTLVTLAGSGSVSDTDSIPTSVTVPNGQTTATFIVASTEDTSVEADETFIVTATLNSVSQSATVTIENDDAPPSSELAGITILAPAESLTGSTAAPTATNTLNLYRETTVPAGTGESGAESLAFDPTNDRVFVTNAQADRIDILNLADPNAVTVAGSIDLRATLAPFPYGEVNSVAVRNGIAAVAVQNADGGENGIIALYNGTTSALIKTIEVGVLPDQLTFSPDGSLLLVANEGERFYDTSSGIPVVDNAPGTITVISVPANAADATVRNTIGFSALDGFEAELDALGIKTLDGTSVTVNGSAVAIPDSTVSQDFEPEYIAVSPDGTKAYVTIQEANAVAVIDLTNTNATSPASLLPLGAIDFNLPGNEGDFSDRDGTGGTASISIGNAPVKGLLQPDAIATFEVGGETYFVTANEGDSRILSGAPDDPALNEARASSLTDPDNPDYARLNVDTVWSTSSDLYAFGGRGFSVFKQNSDGTIVKVDETGGDFEQIVAALPDASTAFNGENGAGFDSRSDNKAAEPEGVVVGEVNGVPYAFVSLERFGGVMVWDLSTPSDVKYVRYIPPTSSDYGPEIIKFVSAEESPNGRPLVLTANEISGSVTVYEVSSDTRISEIQGTGTASALAGNTVTVEAIVIGDFQNGDADSGRNLGGFYLQEERTDEDGNILTSEAIFVSAGSLTGDVQIGDRVRVTGTVAETFGKTVLNATSYSVTQAGAVADVNTLAVEVALPSQGVIQTATGNVSSGTNPLYQPDLEAYENMLVRFTDKLTVTEQFELDRLGEIRLTAGDRPEQFTENNDPSVAGYDASLRDIASRTITFDDGLNGTYQGIDNIVTDGEYTTATAPRMGDTITGLTGVLDYDFNRYRVRAVEDGLGVNDFVSENPRPAEAPDVGGTLKVGSFNVLNYFRTLNTINDSNSDQPGDNTAIGLDPRGADTATEFARQTEKLVNTIYELSPDVLGLLELENNFLAGSSGNAIEYLVDQLNAKAGSTLYAWVDPGQQFVGGDAIAVGMIYKPSKVTIALNTNIAILDDSDPEAAALLSQSTKGAIFNGPDTSRAALAVTFEEVATGGEFTAVVNHFKSKSGNGTGADANQFDGAGAWDQQRELAAKAVVDWLDDSTKPTGTTDADVMILGDLNAYASEDPIDILKQVGYSDLGAAGYSYVFDGQIGSLDHVMTNASLTQQVTGAAEWHINADEADALDYNLNLDSDAANERDPDIFDAATPARVSDHDPLLVGLDLTENGQTVAFGVGSLSLTLTEGSSGQTAFIFTVERSGGTKGEVTFTAALASSTASTADFVGVSALPFEVSGTIAAGQNQATITIEVASDTLVEADEDFTLTLTGATNSRGITTTVADTGAVATGTIADDDFVVREVAGTNKSDVFTDTAHTATTYRAGNGEDVVRGEDGADQLFGGNSQDKLFGGIGDDRLAGENGNDLLTGDLGADLFVFERGGGSDTVVDFNFAEGDRLLRLDGMQIVSVREINTDAVTGPDATEIQFNGASVRLLGLTGVAKVDDLFVL